MKRLGFSGLLPCVLVLWAAAPAEKVHADVKLPSILGSHMVLQRDRALPIWGWADPGEEVTVQLGESSAKAKADDKGTWSVKLAPQGANSKGEVEFDDVAPGKYEVLIQAPQRTYSLVHISSGDGEIAGDMINPPPAGPWRFRYSSREAPQMSKGLPIATGTR